VGNAGGRPDAEVLVLLELRGEHLALTWLEKHDVGTRTRIGAYSGIVNELTTLYRPVGQAELDLIAASDYRAFPSRLPEQPFFYPVLTEAYATQIARDWNVKDQRSGYVGFVLRFQVRTEFICTYDVHVVGSAEHREYWIPSADMKLFNANLVGKIEVLARFDPSERP
jgi:hypothetical protein